MYNKELFAEMEKIIASDVELNANLVEILSATGCGDEKKTQGEEEDIDSCYRYMYKRNLGSIFIELIADKDNGFVQKKMAQALDFINALWLNRLIGRDTFLKFRVLDEYVKDLNGKSFLIFKDEIDEFQKRWRHHVKWNEVVLTIMKILFSDPTIKTYRSLESFIDMLNEYHIGNTLIHLRKLSFEMLCSMIYRNSVLYFTLKSGEGRWDFRKVSMQDLDENWKTEKSTVVLNGIDMITNDGSSNLLNCHIAGTDLSIGYLIECDLVVGVNYISRGEENYKYLSGYIGGFSFVTEEDGEKLISRTYNIHSGNYDMKAESIYSLEASDLSGQIFYSLREGQYIVHCTKEIVWDFAEKINLIEAAFNLKNVPVKYVYGDYIIKRGNVRGICNR